MPYSVYYGDEEHVILYDKSLDWAFDPTSDQFDLGAYFFNDASSTYERFHRLSKIELASTREEGVHYLNRVTTIPKTINRFYGLIR